MSTKSMRILNVAAGVLLIAAGIYCLCNQDVALLSAGLLLGIFLLLSGVAEIVVFAAASGVMLGSGWLLLDGLLTLAGFICLMDPWVSVAAMGMTVGIVFLLEGVSSIVYACISRTKDI